MQAELEQTYPRLGTIYSLCSVYYPNIRQRSDVLNRRNFLKTGFYEGIKVESRSPSTDGDFWRFLKAVYLLSCDFTTSTALQEASVRNVLAQAATGTDPVKTAEATWHELVGIAADSASGAQTFKRSDLPESMRDKHGAIQSPKTALKVLREHSDFTLQGIRSTIAETIILPRNESLIRANEALAGVQVVVLTGPPGSGKSTLAKAVAQWQANIRACSWPEMPELLIATTKDWKQRKMLREKGCPRGRIPKGLSPRDRMERKLLTKRGRALYKKRSVLVEPVFGQVKEGQGFRRFMRRGLGAAQSEWSLAGMTHNLLKLWRSGQAPLGWAKAPWN